MDSSDCSCEAAFLLRGTRTVRVSVSVCVRANRLARARPLAPLPTPTRRSSTLGRLTGESRQSLQQSEEAALLREDQSFFPPQNPQCAVLHCTEQHCIALHCTHMLTALKLFNRRYRGLLRIHDNIRRNNVRECHPGRAAFHAHTHELFIHSFTHSFSFCQRLFFEKN